MKKKYLIIIAASLLIANFVAAQVSSPSYFKKVGSAINLLQSTWDLGSSSSRVHKGYFSDLDSTSATIGTLQISSKIDPGPLVVTASTNPTIRFTGDTDSGIGWLAANKMSLMTNNTNALTVDATGNVGIGTTSPLAKLDIYSLSDGSVTLQIEHASGKWGSDSPFVRYKYSTSTTTDFYTEALNQFVIDHSGSDLWMFTDSNRNISLQKDGGNVGIGTTAPSQKLEINGGMRLNTATAKPTCAAGIRGTLWYVQGGAGVADTVEACTKDASDVYAWRALY